MNMKVPYFILLLLLMACNSTNTNTMQNKLEEVKEKLSVAEAALAKAKTDETTFIHTVFFWMKEEVTAAQKADFVKNGMGKLKSCPQIYKAYYGPPANTPRDVVDNTYDFAWICHFKSKEAQDAYQQEPIHLEFVEAYKDLWDRVQVYDNLHLK